MMNTHADKTQEMKSKSAPNVNAKNQRSNGFGFQFADNRPGTVIQRKLWQMVSSGKQAGIVQKKAGIFSSAKQPAKAGNKTGLPDQLKSGIENLSGYSLDDVKVHYNSNKPAQLHAHAFAQGADIHISAGQETHLPHEAWHVVQQKQGRVKPNMHLAQKINGNNDVVLEHEADIMGAKAVNANEENRPIRSKGHTDNRTIQPMLFERFSGRLSNWGWYNADEKLLLSEEKRADELLTSMTDDPEYGLGVNELLAQLTLIKGSTYAKDKYENLKVELQQIFLKADAFSGKIAFREHIVSKLLSDFNSKPPDATPIQALLDNVEKFKAHPKIGELGMVRNDLDMLSQFVSDAAMKSEDETHMLEIKAPLLKATVNIQKAFFYATVRKNIKMAESCMLIGVAFIQIINKGKLESLAEEGIQVGAKPKQREAAYRIDTGSMMVARAALKAGVSPDLVVGLPTGGAHAASRFAAAAGIISGNTPELWLTRPQGVKEESREFMKGARPDQLFKKSELHILREILLARWKTAQQKGMSSLHVFIIDDGQVSGRTLQMTRVIYEKELRSAGIPVKVFTGIALGGNRDERPEEYIEKHVEYIPADFVMNNSYDRAGPRKVLAETDPDGMGGETLGSHGEHALNVQVTIVSKSNEAPEFLRVRDALDPVQTIPL